MWNQKKLWCRKKYITFTFSYIKFLHFGLFLLLFPAAIFAHEPPINPWCLIPFYSIPTNDNCQFEKWAQVTFMRIIFLSTSLPPYLWFCLCSLRSLCIVHSKLSHCMYFPSHSYLHFIFVFYKIIRSSQSIFSAHHSFSKPVVLLCI